MGFLFRTLFILLFLVVGAGAAFVWFALSDAPELAPTPPLTHADIARAREVIKRNDPRRLPSGSEQTVVVNDSDLNLAMNYLLQTFVPGKGGARVALVPGSARLQASLQVPKLPIRPFLNAELELAAIGLEPRISRLRFGEVEVPAVLGQWLVELALGHAYETSQYQLAEDVIKQLDLGQGQVAVTYVWRPELVDDVKSQLVDADDGKALAAYYEKLVELQSRGVGTQGSLTEVLQPLFVYARDRTDLGGGDPARENRALMAVLASWAAGRGMSLLVPDIKQRPKLRSIKVTLEGRHDFPQHFLISAAISSAGDISLSNAVGVFKEVKDSRGGSGFSFTDIVADRAGTEFGELAVASSDSARDLQAFMAKGAAETDIMPKARDLPEHMTEAEFESRYGGVDSPKYRRVMDEIERRIAACELYRKP